LPFSNVRGDPVSAFLRGGITATNSTTTTTTATATTAVTRQPLSLEKVPLNKSGLTILSENSCWREIRLLCERCLQFGFAPHENLLYRFGAILAHFRLHHYDTASKVMDSLGDLNNSGNYFYESYPHIYNNNNNSNSSSNHVGGQKRGNMVPFSMLLLKALMPHFDSSGQPNNPRFSTALSAASTSAAITAQSGGGSGGSVSTPPATGTAAMNTPMSTGGSVGSALTPNTPTTMGAPSPMSVSPNASSSAYASSASSSSAEPGTINHLNSHSVSSSAGTQMALDRLYRLLNMCRRPNLQQRYDPDCTVEQWFIREQRVIMMIINCHICRREYYLAQELLSQVIDRLEKASEKDEEALDTFILFKSLQGCLYLQSGIIMEAENIFNSLKQKVDMSNPRHKVRCFLNEGYLLFSRGKTGDASREFACALEIDPDNVVAANNQAICLLHLCQLSKAIELLEDVIRRNPATNLDEVLVYNLCTLYDLEADPTSNEKIAVIRILTERYAGDDFLFVGPQ